VRGGTSPGVKLMDDEALYIISVAARMVGMHAQTLRKYERAGFLLPSRTDGRLRLYSRDDLRRLRQIKRLVEAGELNLAGVELALGLTDEMLRLLGDLNATDDPTELRVVVRTRVVRMLRALEARAD
jgi:MerR family transcriptional regulator, heat shock protein HspR